MIDYTVSIPERNKFCSHIDFKKIKIWRKNSEKFNYVYNSFVVCPCPNFYWYLTIYDG